MNEASQTSRPPMLPGLDSDTSSLASADGATRCDSQASPMTPTSGPGRVRVSHSRPRARGAERATLDIFGQHGSHSSSSVALQSSLESKLRATTDLDGSMLYSLTWSDAVTPSGRRICRLAASRRTSGNGFSSWPTPRQDAASSGSIGYARTATHNPGVTLTDAARMAGWSTPQAGQASSGYAEDKTRPTSNGNRGGHRGNELLRQANAAGWATPTVSQAGGTARQYRAIEAKHGGCGLAITDLGLQVSTWIRGEMPSGSIASTESAARSQLNPRFSLWLMGYPTAWASCGEAVTRSSRKSRRRSSGQR